MLQKADYKLEIFNGIDTKTNEKIVTGKFLEMHNCEMKNYEIVKCTGFSQLGNTSTDTFTSYNYDRIICVKDELVFFTNNKIYTYDKNSDLFRQVKFDNSESSFQALNIKENVLYGKFQDFSYSYQTFYSAIVLRPTTDDYRFTTFSDDPTSKRFSYTNDKYNVICFYEENKNKYRTNTSIVTANPQRLTPIDSSQPYSEFTKILNIILIDRKSGIQQQRKILPLYSSGGKCYLYQRIIKVTVINDVITIFFEVAQENQTDGSLPIEQFPILTLCSLFYLTIDISNSIDDFTTKLPNYNQIMVDGMFDYYAPFFMCYNDFLAIDSKLVNSVSVEFYDNKFHVLMLYKKNDGTIVNPERKTDKFNVTLFVLDISLSTVLYKKDYITNSTNEFKSPELLISAYNPTPSATKLNNRTYNYATIFACFDTKIIESPDGLKLLIYYAARSSSANPETSTTVITYFKLLNLNDYSVYKEISGGVHSSINMRVVDVEYYNSMYYVLVSPMSSNRLSNNSNDIPRFMKWDISNNTLRYSPPNGSDEYYDSLKGFNKRAINECYAASRIMKINNKIYYAAYFLNTVVDRMYGQIFNYGRAISSGNDIRLDEFTNICSLFLLDEYNNIVDCLMQYDCKTQKFFYVIVDTDGKIYNRQVYENPMSEVVCYRDINITDKDYYFYFNVKSNSANSIAVINQENSFNEIKYFELNSKIERNPKSFDFGRSSYILFNGMIYEFNKSQISDNNFYNFPTILPRRCLVDGFLSSRQKAYSAKANLNYAYTAIYETTNLVGDIIRSQPAIIRVLPKENVDRNIDVLYTTPYFIHKNKNIKIKIYRTKGDENTFYNVKTINQNNYLYEKTLNYVNYYSENSGGNANVTRFYYPNCFTDLTPDSSVTDSEILYINGGILGDMPFPSLLTMTKYNGRIYAVPRYNKNRILYSKIERNGYALATNIAYYVDIESNGGDIKELIQLDDKLIIFKESSIYFITGDGADDKGQNQNFSPAILINSTIGCTETESIIKIPAGIMFKSNKGIYILDRSLNVQYIGASVEKYNVNKVIDAINIDKENKVKFLLDNSIMLTFDYFYNTWSTQDTLNFKNLCYYGDSLVACGFNPIFSTTTPRVYFNDKNSYRLDTLLYEMRLKTEWIKLNGIQSFQRIYDAKLLGNFVADFGLKTKTYYNFENVISSEKINYITRDNGSKIFQAKISMSKQKCESLMLEISDNSVENGFTLSDIVLSVGVNQGTYRVKPTKSYPS